MRQTGRQVEEMVANWQVGGAVAGLKELLGPNGWLEGDEMASYLIDERRDFRGDAVVVVRPASTAEVAGVAEVCARYGLAIVAQGGNTGLSGGSVPSPSPNRTAVLLSLARMRAIEDVNPDRFTITAQAGVTITDLQEVARAVDRVFAPDWGARGTATIGGAIATNAGGMNVLRYGTMRDQILGLEVVLADGRIWNGLRALRKDSSGYDLKHLFIGSEGTLGIVTRAVVKLHPYQPEHRSAFVALTDIDRLSEMYNLARSVIGENLTAFELVPEIGVALASERYPHITRPMPSTTDWYLLLRVDGRARNGNSDLTERLVELLTVGTDAGLVVDAVVAETPVHDANLWALRDELSPVRLLGGYLLKYDLAVPIDRIAEAHSEIRRLVSEEVPGAVPYAFGHVGDGNLHLSVLSGTSEPGQLEARAGGLQAAIDALVWRLGGTISAEHGIGQELADRLPGQKPPVELDLMRDVKHLLDPDGRLNPGKLLRADR